MWLLWLLAIRLTRRVNSALSWDSMAASVGRDMVDLRAPCCWVERVALSRGKLACLVSCSGVAAGAVCFALASARSRVLLGQTL